MCVNTGFLKVNIGNKEITTFLRHATKSPFLFSTKCCLFHNFIFFFSNNTFFIKHVLKYEYQPNR